MMKEWEIKLVFPNVARKQRQHFAIFIELWIDFISGYLRVQCDAGRRASVCEANRKASKCDADRRASECHADRRASVCLKSALKRQRKQTCLTLSWRRLLSYRNQSIDLRSKSVDWFLYDKDPRHQRVEVNKNTGKNSLIYALVFL